MTTGRINQVTAEAWSRRAAALAVTRGLDRCFLDGATMRPRTGFALVRITALRRRQDPSANFFSSLGWGPADRRLRCTSTFAELFGNELTTAPDVRRWVRRAIGAVG